MSAPVLTLTGQGQSKTAGTTLAVTLTTTSYVVGDYVRATFGMDPAAGSVSFAKSAGTATVGTWTTLVDNTSGSGTSGARLVTAYAKVTTAGTITTITVTHPSVTARAAEVYKVAGANPNTPVLASGQGVFASAGTANLAIPASAIGRACLVIGPSVDEAPSATSATQITNTGFSASYTETASFGTTGSAAASNISVVTLGESNNNTSAGTVSPYDGGVSPKVVGSELWTDTAPSNLKGADGAGQITLTWDAYTGATAYLVERSADGSTGWTTVYSGSATSTIDTVAAANAPYWYRITATVSGASTATSNSMRALSLPFTDDFSSSNLNNWTIVTHASSGNISLNTSALNGYMEVHGLIDPTDVAYFTLNFSEVTGPDMGITARASWLGNGVDTQAFIGFSVDGVWSNTTGGSNLNAGYQFTFSAFTTNPTGALLKNSPAAATITASPAPSGDFAQTWTRIRFERAGAQLRYRIWPDGSTEPTWWTIGTDSTYNSFSALMIALTGPATNIATNGGLGLDDIQLYIPGPNASRINVVSGAVTRAASW